MSSAAFQRNPKPASPRRKRGKDYAMVLIGAVMLTIPLLLITGERNEVISKRYRISELRKGNEELVQQQRKLRAELSRLSRPNRIFEEALRQGLRPTPPDRRLKIEVREETMAEPTLVASMGDEP